MKKIKLILLIILGIIILMIGILLYFLQLSIWGTFYWFILIFLVFVKLLLEFSSKYILLAAFILFLCSALITTVGLQVLGELTMRISFIFWIVGIIQAVEEYRKLPG